MVPLFAASVLVFLESVFAFTIIVSIPIIEPVLAVVLPEVDEVVPLIRPLFVMIEPTSPYIPIMVSVFLVPEKIKSMPLLLLLFVAVELYPASIPTAALEPDTLIIPLLIISEPL